jgi:hypothetical protein
MIEVYSSALDSSIEVERFIGKIKGAHDGPTVIFTGGIHGNEPSGVFALKEVMEKLTPLQDKIHGNIYAISGNLWALERQERFEKEDLNRLWTKERMIKILEGKESELEQNADTKEQLEIFHEINRILQSESGPFFFLDLHTTSSDTIPFLTVNDTLLNRKFSLQFPVPIILGIEEYLDGPLLSYINHLGYIAVGFESGQHDALTSITNHVAFSMLAIETAGCLRQDEIPGFDDYLNLLEDQSLNIQNIFEITYRHGIHPKEEFKMYHGYSNFDSIHKGEALAKSNGESLLSDRSGRIFMPLYQDQGNDGYFIIRRTPYLFLQLSKIFRKIRLDKALVLLPGVRWETKERDTLIIRLRIARFFAKEFLHLLGYRSRMIDATHMYAKNRERSSREDEYKDLTWF